MSLLLMRGSPLRSLLSTSGLVAAYLPYLQIAQGLHTGANAQVVLDYSPAGDNAQNGSTTGADTNDASFSTDPPALTFGGDDRCVAPSFAVGNLTTITVLKINTATSVDGVLWTRGNVRTFWNEAGSKIYIAYRANSGNKLGGYVSASKNTWYPLIIRANTTGSASISITGVGTMASLDFAIDNDISYGFQLGAWGVSAYLLGDIACHVMFNRVLSDGETSRVRANIVALMNGQGVAIL